MDARYKWRFNTLYHFPIRKSDSFASKFANGWWMGNIISAQTGYAFTPVDIGDVSLSGINGVNAYSDRPYLIVDPNQAGPVAANPDVTCHTNTSMGGRAPTSVGTAQAWFNPCAFATQPLGHLGNVSRGFLTGPGLFNWDFSLNKDTRLAFLGEAGNLQFRAEFFNLFNHANFSNPNSSIAGFGAGRIFQARDGRDIQLALKLNF